MRRLKVSPILFTEEACNRSKIELTHKRPVKGLVSGIQEANHFTNVRFLMHVHDRDKNDICERRNGMLEAE